MNNVSRALSKLIMRYYQALHHAGTDCRLVVPGLTKKIAENLHQLLIDDGYPSYLVIPNSDCIAPSELERKVAAVGLTSLRQGSMIIVTYPGEIPNLQDSLVGAGGAIRSFAFSDEWPWVGTNNNNFRFDDIFLDILISEWTADPLVRNLLKEFIKDGLLKQTSRCNSRADLFLNGMLDDFNPAEHSTENILDRFLFFCGAPFSILPEKSIRLNVNDYLTKATGLIKSIALRHEQANVRSELRGYINEINFSDSDTAMLITSYAEEFFDGVSSQDQGLPIGIVSLRNCWQGDIKRWKCFDIDTLAKIYNVPLSKQTVNLELQLRCDGAAVISLDRTKAVLPSLENVFLKISIDVLEEFGAGQFTLKITHRKKILAEIALSTPSYESEIELTTEMLPESFFNLPLKVSVWRGGDKALVEKNVTIFLLDESHPFLAVVQDPFKIFQPVNIDGNDDFEKIVVTEPVDVFILNDNSEEFEVLVNDQSMAIVYIDDLKRVARIESRLDPEAASSGQAEVQIIAKEHQHIIFSIEAEDIARGEYGLESEYISQIFRGDKSKLRKISSIFEGDTAQPYPLLGGVNDQTRKLGFIASLMESEEYQGQPVLANLRAEWTRRSLEFGYWNLSDSSYAELEFSESADDVRCLLNGYHAARQKVLKSLRRDFLEEKSRPMYAAYPIFIENRSVEIELVLTNYLAAYFKILDFVKVKHGQIIWEDLFLLCNVDCVQILDDSNSLSRVFLMGPWHPLVAAKRYMTQSVIHDCGRKSIESGASWKFSRLAPLIEQNCAFRWLPNLLSLDNTVLEYAFISPTSDPGWLMGLPSAVVDQNKQIDAQCLLVRQQLGLEIAAFPLAREQMALSYMRSYVKSFSDNRALTIHAPPSYSSERLVQSAEELLYRENDLTFEGLQLTGGVHLLLHATDEIDSVPWRLSPICVYEVNDSESHKWEEAKDIDLLPPIGGLKLINLSENIPVSRGDMFRSIFRLPIRGVDIGRGGRPTSFEIEYEQIDVVEGDLSLSASFLNVLNLIQKFEIENKRAAWTFQLPDTLEYVWSVLPGGYADPAVFVHYIKDGMRRAREARALWDYRISIAKKVNSYYILAKLPSDVKYALSGSPVFHGKDVASSLIYDLGLVGIAIGGESMRSGSHALGVIGVAAAIRMMTEDLSGNAPLKNDDKNLGFILSADSFYDLLGGALDVGVETDTRRGDLVAVQTRFDDSSNEVIFSFLGIECKYSSSKFPTEQVESALEQAERSFSRIDELARSCADSDGMLERLALSKLVEFGLRILSVNHPELATLHRQSKIMSAILSGRVKVIKPSETIALLFTTECKLDSPSLVKGRGWWIRMCPSGWPGVSDSSALSSIRVALNSIFDTLTSNNSDKSEVVAGSKIDMYLPKSVQVKESTPNDGPVKEISVTKNAQAVEGAMTSAPQVVSNIINHNLQSVPLMPILLGVSRGGERVYYDPQKKEKLVENYNMMITGSPGKGKTQLLKTLVSEVRRQEKNVVMLDFKNDYSSDEGFLEEANLSVKHIAFTGLPPESVSLLLKNDILPFKINSLRV